MFKAFYAAIYDRISSGAERAGLSEVPKARRVERPMIVGAAARCA
jgi:hypothetical protein